MQCSGIDGRCPNEPKYGIQNGGEQGDYELKAEEVFERFWAEEVRVASPVVLPLTKKESARYYFLRGLASRPVREEKLASKKENS